MTNLGDSAETKSAFKATQEAVSKKLVATVRTAGQLAAEDIGFLGSSDPAAKRKLEKQNRNLLKLAQGLITNASPSTAIPELKKPEKIDENWRSVVDVIDGLLERADRCLDEYHGVIRRLGTEKEESAQANAGNVKSSKTRRIHPLSKPQLSFKHVPKNDETTAFRPLLTSKPHAKVPLEECLRSVAGESGLEEYKHPYETEITDSTYPPSVYLKSEPIPPIDDPDGKTLTWVDTPEQVAAMLKELKEANEIAIDLEHHDQHSYVGLVCLMQVSTRSRDWIVDTLKPWRQDLQVLNEVFADPNILKVFHGSTHDMIWLQRDLGLYVVGLFDTYHATVELNKQRHSLASLLKDYENFDAQKQYQMADWRTRPLTDEMMHYARADTHYLLHIYDNLRNELIDANGVDYVLRESKKEALQRYDRFIYDTTGGEGPIGWLNLLVRTPARFQKDQFSVFKAVHQFRDKVARQTDESLLAVMRNDTIFALARSLPEDMPALMSCIHPVSQFVQPKLTELLNVIKKAQTDLGSGPDLDEILAQADAVKTQRKAEKRKRYQQNQAPGSGQTATTIGGVGAVLDNIRDATQVAEASQFWGSMLESPAAISNTGTQRGLHAMEGLRLSLPVPQVSTIEAVSKSTNTCPAPPAQEPVSEPQESATFTLKALRKSDLKRKAEEQNDDRPHKQQLTASDDHTRGDLGDQNDFEALDDGEDKHRKRKRGERTHVDSDAPEPSQSDWSKYTELKGMSKPSRKIEFQTKPGLQEIWARCSAQRKMARKAGKQEPAAEKEEEEKETVPFDYTKAPSLLSDAKGVERGRKKDREKKKEFDPYAKALDTPKGLPKPRQGGAGKSKTFK